MKTKNNIKTLVGVLSLALFFSLSSCTKDLERTPIVETTGDAVFSNFDNYPNALAKLYGGLAHGGQEAGGGGGPRDTRRQGAADRGCGVGARRHHTAGLRR